MQKWVRIKAGNYISKDKRFVITQIGRSIWVLEDCHTSLTYEYLLLRRCKLEAEKILKNSKS